MRTHKYKIQEFVRVVFLVATAILASFPLGCSKSTPACDSGKVIDGVIFAVGQDIRKNLAGIASVGGPGMELSDDEWRSIRAGMVIGVDNIKEQGFDANSGKRTCSGSVTITDHGKAKTTQMTYFAELDKTSGEVKTLLSQPKPAKEDDLPQAPQ